MNFIKEYRKTVFFVVVTGIFCSAASESLFAMNNCQKNARDLLTSLERARVAAQANLEAIDAAIVAARKSVDGDAAASIQGAHLAISEMRALRQKTLSNKATFSMIHGDIDDAAKQVWRDDTTNLAWSPVATRAQLDEIQKQKPLTFVVDGREYADHWAMAKAYCESLVIPGLDGIKWTLPEAGDFLKAANNATRNVTNEVNKLLTEALSDMKDRWFWSSSPHPYYAAYALYFYGNNGKVDSGRVIDYFSVRCVSR